ncbi:hypothetical protein [Hydrogenimonas urashimensis]|uniref:hypothetical protein n=1 Tax=Hydrogenimonas urashimensis TaxID=2740515 RepID=UPI001915E78A|nr:hypothetical protein [Hydrogenimonas urashimensis]
MPDILDNITAIHSHEERYDKLELLYRNEAEKKKILNAIDRLNYRKECQVEISDVREGENRGFIAVEFHDDYDKEAGPFFDALMKTLGIDRCE